MNDGFLAYYRSLPHWRARHAVYHVTWRLHAGQPALSAEERRAVVSALKHFDGDRYALFAYVVMDDHVHVVVNPGDTPLEKVLQAWKSFLAHRLTAEHGRTAPVWQREYYDRIVRSDRELEDTLAYVLYNPLERWPELGEYAWVWAKGVSD